MVWDEAVRIRTCAQDFHVYHVNKNNFNPNFLEKYPAMTSELRKRKGKVTLKCKLSHKCRGPDTVTERTLVVDDDPLILRSVERILTRAGYEVVTAKNVEEAARYANRFAFDAALVDYDLASENGLTVLANLRDSQPSCLRILMTGHTDFPMVVEAVNRGEVLRVIRKPFDPAGLTQILTDAFESMKRMAEVATAQQQAAEFQERLMLEDCFKNEMLQLALQPIVSATNNKNIIAYEALLRSSHPVLKDPFGPTGGR